MLINVEPTVVENRKRAMAWMAQIKTIMLMYHFARGSLQRKVIMG